MAAYVVKVSVRGTLDVRVTADDPDEAAELAGDEVAEMLFAFAGAQPRIEVFGVKVAER